MTEANLIKIMLAEVFILVAEMVFLILLMICVAIVAKLYREAPRTGRHEDDEGINADEYRRAQGWE